MRTVEEARHGGQTSIFGDDSDDNDNGTTCLEVDVICNVGG